MKKSSIVKKIIPLLLFPLGLLLTYITSSSPAFTEKWYSLGINRYIRQFLSNFAGIFPFSLSEILVSLFLIFAIYMLIRSIIRIIKNKGKRFIETGKMIYGILAIVSIVYFLYLSLWGLNYNRQPFSVISGLEIKKTSTDELVSMCEDLIERTNTLRLEVQEDENGVMRLKTSKREMFKNAEKGFEKAGEIYSELLGTYGRPKGLIFSVFMSYQGLTGVYSPYTGEPNVNIYEPIFMLPATTSHEIAHQRGFAREDEANYIAYLTCILHPDKDFQYSGTLLALIHSMNALYADDYDEFSILYDKYSEGVKRDLQYNRDYWKQYEGIIEEISDKVNDVYLKANGQEDGLKSYGRMVDLLLAEYRIFN